VSFILDTASHLCINILSGYSQNHEISPIYRNLLTSIVRIFSRRICPETGQNISENERVGIHFLTGERYLTTPRQRVLKSSLLQNNRRRIMSRNKGKFPGRENHTRQREGGNRPGSDKAQAQIHRNPSVIPYSPYNWNNSFQILR